MALPALRGASAGIQAAAVAVLLLSAASRIAIPIGPVPITLQTLVVTLAGAVLGVRLGVVAVLSWLAAGAAGLPVLAGGTAGVARFVGPTGGYLLAFPFAAGLVGWLSARGWSGTMRSALGEMLLGNALCLLIGATWLAMRTGLASALAAGLWPFLPGAIVKALAGALIVRWIVHKQRPAA